MSPKYLSLIDAFKLFINEQRVNIWTPYQIGLLIYSLYQTKKYQAFHLKIRKNKPQRQDYYRIITGLIQHDIIRVKGNNVFYILPGGKPLLGEPTCAVDPFAYISHFSAMHFHQLINYAPDKIFLSSLPAKQWSEQATLVMQRDLRDEYKSYRQTGLPVLINISSANLEPVSIYRSVKLGDSQTYNYNRTRVSSIGRTFLDMLRRPDLCNGIDTTLKVFKNHAKKHINPIIYEIDQFGSKIDKVRAGYIIEAYCDFNNEIINSWEQYAMRGGSRKLDPFNDYAPTYSDRWKLSLNIKS